MRRQRLLLLIAWVYLIIALLTKEIKAIEPDQRHSPFNQKLPSCDQGFLRVKKETTEKAILCPMYRDEEGFLSEWVGYYQMHGFDHIMLFDDGSIDNSRAELQPWLDTGFVTIESNWTTQSLNVSWHFLKNSFKSTMATKALLERKCKLYAIEHGYRYFISLDIDEYVIPAQKHLTVVDSLHKWFTSSKRSVCCINKRNFQSTPHILEPVNLLTIEAYQTRMREVRRMNYYTTVMPKCAYDFRGPKNTPNVSQEFIASCCHFHGCQGHDFVEGSEFCKTHYKEEGPKLSQGGAWPIELSINHYSRSLEKYAIKAQTWRTSSGEVKEGEKQEDVIKNYDLNKFFQRSVGWYFDDVAVMYGCQLREHLANITKQTPYLRPGTIWYRNVEFGKHLSIPDKRGRYGRPNPEGFHWKDDNIFLYTGKWPARQAVGGEKKEGGGGGGGGAVAAATENKHAKNHNRAGGRHHRENS